MLYDVGTDHAYLPVHLLSRGRIVGAVASDIASGPLSHAAETVRCAGFSDRVELRLADGLRGIELIPPCDVVIAGMGGEMIAAILSAAPQVRAEDVRLLLQPMTRVEELRSYLAKEGFSCEEECVVREGKLYTLISCHYTGVPYLLTDEEMLLGARTARREDALFFALVEAKIAVLTAVIEGKTRGGIDASDELRLRHCLDEVLQRRNPHDR